MTTPMPSDEEIIRAVRLGRLAAHAGRAMLDACPYPPEQRVLRWRYAQGYAEGKTDGPTDWLAAVKDWLRRFWYGDDDD